MGEAFGITSGVLSIVGVTGQLVESAVFLHNFFSDLKGAPKRVRDLGEELGILNSILRKIEKSFTKQNVDLEQALKHCGNCLNELLDFVKTVDPNQHAKKGQRLWSQLKVTLKRSDLSRYLGDLDRSKSLLLQACANITREEQTCNSNRLQVMNTSLTDLSSEQRACNATSRATLCTVEELKDSSSRLQSTSARVFNIVTETQANIDEVSQNTAQIRAMTERIEQTTKALAQERFDHLPKAFKSLGDQVNHTISRTLNDYLRQHFRRANADIWHENLCHDEPGQRQDLSDIEASFKSRCFSASRQKVDSLGVGQACTTKYAWIKKSSTLSQQVLTRNALLGALSIWTTTVSYRRKDEDSLRSDTKQVSTTILTFLPSPWLATRGIVFQYQRSRFFTGSREQSIPRWTVSTVNVVHGEAEIFKACKNHDLGTIRRLFDCGLASPYDVSPCATNLLGFVTSSREIYNFSGKHETVQTRIDNLSAIVTLLIDLGVDPGFVDFHNQNTIINFAIGGFPSSSEVPITTSQLDCIRFLNDKLLTSAQADPFCSGRAFVAVTKEGKVWFLGHGISEEISILHLEVIFGQKEWQMQYHPCQLHELTGAIWKSCSLQVENAHTHIHWWVTSQAVDVETYLQAKLLLVRWFLDRDILCITQGDEHCVLVALKASIVEGGRVMALLSELDYYESGSPPWIRHRFKKLALFERWLAEVFQLLLTHGSKYLAEPGIMGIFHHHAQHQNTRTLCAWLKALRACTKDTCSPSRFGMNCVDCGRNGEIADINELEPEPGEGNQHPEIDDTENKSLEWETEEEEVGEQSETEQLAGDKSEWETEEEWEEGYMLATATDTDNGDAINPQIGTDERNSRAQGWEDYDEKYWKMWYPRWTGSDMDTVLPVHSESMLRRLARYTAKFVSSAA